MGLFEHGRRMGIIGSWAVFIKTWTLNGILKSRAACIENMLADRHRGARLGPPAKGPGGPPQRSPGLPADRPGGRPPQRAMGRPRRKPGRAVTEGPRGQPQMIHTCVYICLKQ